MHNLEASHHAGPDGKDLTPEEKLKERRRVVGNAARMAVLREQIAAVDAVARDERALGRAIGAGAAPSGAKACSTNSTAAGCGVACGRSSPRCCTAPLPLCASPTGFGLLPLC